MSVAGTKNFDQPPHDSNRTHLVFSTSGLLLGSRAPLVFCLRIMLLSSGPSSESFSAGFFSGKYFCSFSRGGPVSLPTNIPKDISRKNAKIFTGKYPQRNS